MPVRRRRLRAVRPGGTVAAAGAADPSPRADIVPHPPDRSSPGSLLRVALYTDARGRGGAEISLANLLGALPPGIEPAVLGVDADVVRWIAARRAGTPWRVLPDGPARWPAHAAALRRLGPGVLHVNRCVPWACAAAIAAGLATPRLRIVAVDQLPLRTTAALPLWRTRALSLRADGLVAPGTASARRMEDFYALGRGTVRSIPNGVPDAPPTGRAPRGDGPLRVAAVGRLDAVKGYDVLLRAVARVDGARLTIFGEGAERGALQALAGTLGIGDRVAMPGWDEDVRARLADFDVLALPSRSEGFPLVVPEAMLAGLPVVATPVGGVEEAVRDGETGLLVPVGDAVALAAALSRLAADPPLRAALGAAGRQGARARFTAARMAAAYAALWREVVRRPRAPRVRVPAPRP